MKNRASSMRDALVRCGRAPLSICDRYDWLNPLPTSFLSATARSCCVISRSMPRNVPSTRRRYRSFSPSFILQLAIIILQSVMSRTGFGLLSRNWEARLLRYSVALSRGGLRPFGAQRREFFVGLVPWMRQSISFVSEPRAHLQYALPLRDCTYNRNELDVVGRCSSRRDSSTL